MRPAGAVASEPRTKMKMLTMATACLVLVMSCSKLEEPSTVASIEVVPVESILAGVGATVQLTAVAKDHNGQAITGQTFTWSSSNEDVAVVDGGGLVITKGAGVAWVSAAIGSYEGYAVVSVLTAADILPDSLTLALDQVFRLTVATDVMIDNASGVVQWSSSDPAVAGVDVNGVVTALAAGTTTISSSLYDVLDSVVVIVSDAIKVEWQLSGSRFWGSPGIASDGTLYVGWWWSIPYLPVLLPITYTPMGPGGLAAIEVDGAQRWELREITSSLPVVASDGAVYAGGLSSQLLAIYPDGGTKWAADIPMGISPAPALAADGTIYVGHVGSTLHALNPDGTPQWEFLASGSLGTPSIGPDSTIFISGVSLHAIRPDGTLKWNFYGDGDLGAAAIGEDGTIYVGSYVALYAVNSDGTERWNVAVDGALVFSPVIGVDGTVYLASDDLTSHSIPSRLYAIAPDGQVSWDFALDGNWRWASAPVIGADGTIYVTSWSPWFSNVAGDTEYLPPVCYALNPDGTLKWAFMASGSALSLPAIGADGTIYVGSSHDPFFVGHFYAMSETAGSNGGLAESPWPKPGHDKRNTGNALLR